LTSVDFPAATEIGGSAFYGCTGLGSVNIPKATAIGTYAFASSGDTALTITLGMARPTLEIGIFDSVASKSVTVKVPAGAKGNYDETWKTKFKDGNNNIELTIDDGTGGGDITDPLTSVQDILSILKNATGGGSADNPIRLPVEIEASDWDGLLSVIGTSGKYVALDLATSSMYGEFDSGTSSIGKEYITSLVLPNTATGIKAGVNNDPTFNGFTNLKSVSGEGVANVGSDAFQNCSALETVSFPNATKIGNNAFVGCSHLTSVNLPAVNEIGGLAFWGCTSLIEIELLAATKIGSSLFWNCKNLKTVNFPSANELDANVFGYCTSLTTVNLPAATKIGNGVFMGTGGTALTVKLNRNNPTLGENMFQDVNVPKTVTVKVPADAGGYDETWQTKFKDGNDKISLNIMVQ
jgi:hypothetical protein